MLENHTEQIRNGFLQLMGNSVFTDAISLSTNSTQKVRTRFELAEANLQEVLK
jgi:hypothetical protein